MSDSQHTFQLHIYLEPDIPVYLEESNCLVVSPVPLRKYQHMQVCARHCELILVACEQEQLLEEPHLGRPNITRNDTFHLLINSRIFLHQYIRPDPCLGCKAHSNGPPDRNWTAQADNIAPCGSPDNPSNRTEFPLSQGAVALKIADEAWNVAICLATGNGKLWYFPPRKMKHWTWTQIRGRRKIS